MTYVTPRTLLPEKTVRIAFCNMYEVAIRALLLDYEYSPICRNVGASMALLSYLCILVISMYFGTRGSGLRRGAVRFTKEYNHHCLKGSWMCSVSLIVACNIEFKQLI